ncbi:MAG: EscU/YscU/HrcU family type III secretion system export apparatus switch protein [Alphaproteobacteria bacterium]|nr:EscU/YscU/HrcU family type III secretion system export apparatus switch protein [Alphaproteobacteria bacterium]
MTDHANSRPPPRGHQPASETRKLAIALSHDIDGGAAPTVVAKGYGELAEKILRLAFDHDVKVRTDPDLAQILEVVEVDCEIPVEAFAAVAEILTYVYRANGAMSEKHATAAATGDTP